MYSSSAFFIAFIQIFVASGYASVILRAKRQASNSQCVNGGTYLLKSCTTANDCQGIASVPALCLNAVCCTDGSERNQTAAVSTTACTGGQSLGTTCQTSATCQTLVANSATFTPTCLNGQCCAIPNGNTGINNGNTGGIPSSGGACVNGGQSLGVSCSDVSQCTQATTAPTQCLNGICCLTPNSGATSVNNGNNSPIGACANGLVSLGVACSVSTQCTQVSPTANCLNGVCCASSPNTGNTGINNNGACTNGGQSLGVSCTVTSQCTQFSASALCLNGLCCNSSTGNTGISNGTMTGVGGCGTGTSLGISCSDSTTCSTLTTSPVTCLNGLCCANVSG